MKESVGYTVTLNIMIVFITIVVAFLCAALIYFKSNKVSNVITTSIEKYEGYNTSSINEINMNLSSLGYNSMSINCDSTVTDKGARRIQALNNSHNVDADGLCKLVSNSNGQGSRGYCVYLCMENVDYYYYKIRTNMMINIPIINDLLNIPVYSNTNRLYNFDGTIDGVKYRQ